MFRRIHHPAGFPAATIVLIVVGWVLAEAVQSATWQGVDNPPTAAETAVSTQAPAEKSPSSSSGPSAAKGTDEKKPDDSGKGRVTIPEESLKEFLEWKKRRNGPDYAVNSVALDGQADGKRAEMTATLSVQVLRSDEWVRVPVSLNEAQLLKTEHEFLGTSPNSQPKADSGDKDQPTGLAAFSDVDREGAGYRWWFRGRGFHRLKLSLVVPVTSTVAQRRLRLSLPPLAAASTLRLKVADPKLSVVPQDGVDFRVQRDGRGASLIHGIGLGRRLDLHWRTLPTSKGQTRIVEAHTAILVDFTDESALLTARQRIQALGGIDHFRVQLPVGYEVLSVKGKFLKGHQLDGNNRATVELTEPRPEGTELTWILRRSFSARDGQLALAGFEVEGAKVQSGEIAVTKVQGLRAKQLSQSSQAVHRIRSREFAAQELIRDKALTAVYRFLKQPFRLHLELSRVKPHVTVAPEIRLYFSESKVVMNAEFRVHVSEDGAAVREIEIRWPGWKTEGWTIRPLEASAPIEKRTLNPDDDASPIQISLSGRRSGDFIVPLAAERSLEKENGGLTFRLPSLSATVTRPTSLIVVRAPNLELDLSHRDETPLLAIPSPEGDELTRRYRVASASTVLSARINVRQQSLRATSTVTLTPKPNAVEFRQQIKLRVKYVPLASVVLEVPPAIAEHVSFFGSDGRRYSPQATTSEDGNPSVDIRLAAATRGDVEIVVLGSVPLSREITPGSERSLAIPFVTVAGTPLSQLRVQTGENSVIEIDLEGDWRRLVTLDGTPAWSTETPAGPLSMRLRFPDVPRSRSFSIPRALIRATIGHGGPTRYRAQYRVGGNLSSLVIHLPGRAELESAWWDEQPISGIQKTRVGPEGTTYRLTLPETADRPERLLTVDYHSRTTTPSRWITSHELSAPRFPGNVWIEETVWQVTLPENRHLSAYSSGFVPGYRWVRNVIVWTREPTSRFEDSERWIGASRGPEMPKQSAGNVYHLLRYGPADGLTVQAMSRSVIVLLGAGAAWLVGVLLVKLPRLRTVATLLTCGLIAAVVGLWFTTQMTLLLQPAVLGVVLAAGIVAIDRTRKRRRVPAVITVANPSELARARSSVESSARPSPLVGSEDPTAVRAPAVPSDSAAPSSSVMRRGG